MNVNENFQSLKEVYEELLSEKKEIENKIQNNLNDIREIDLYIKSLFDKENNDYELFSPRNIQSIYKDEIETQKLSKIEIEEKNRKLFIKNNLYDKKVTKLLSILKNMKSEEVNNNENNIEYDSTNIIQPIEKEKINYTVLDIQEKERQRIARDLHDSTVQNLTHLIHKIELSSKYIDQDIIRAKMELVSVNKHIKSIIDDMRNIIFNLRPMEFDDIGIKAAFEKLLVELQIKTKMTIEFNIQTIIIEDKLVVISVFHIVQEFCNNAIKHSFGELLKVTIKQTESQLYIEIEDDGIGFDFDRKIEDKHFGLIMAKERIALLYGKMKIQSDHDKGTKISVSLPI